MANQEHLALLNQGAKVWNAWRKEHPHIQPDLSGVNLDYFDGGRKVLEAHALTEAYITENDIYQENPPSLDLSGVNFCQAHLQHAQFGGANFSQADLRGADLLCAGLLRTNCSYARLDEARLYEAEIFDANLSYATLQKVLLANAHLSGSLLRGADISEADLSSSFLHEVDLSNANLRNARLNEAVLKGADFTQTNLSLANLSGADLSLATFVRSVMTDANLTGAALAGTVFADCDLSTIKGLETTKHWGPSTLGMDTLYRSRGMISEVFLRGMGIPDSLIAALPSFDRLWSGNPNCIICYNHPDITFAEELCSDLQQNAIRCWATFRGDFGGSRRRPARLYDRVLLVLSEYHLPSPGSLATSIIEEALVQESQEQRRTLFLICLDEIAMASIKENSLLMQNPHTIQNFVNWTHDDDYLQALTRLLSSLKQ